ncbi:MAG: primosomal protein N' [Desulfotignum sp.]|nr:primosomal protein N' [Desulfotignum sp.]
MTQWPFMDVAVTLPMPHSFVYAVPDYLSDTCRPGMRVLVPFGKRRVTGYILKGRKDSGDYTAKKILDVLDDHPLFPENEIPFFRWVADYYMHPLGETIKTALPTGLDRRDVAHIRTTKQGRTALKNPALSPAESRILTLADTRQGISRKQLFNTMDSPSLRSLLKKMQDSGWLSVTAVLKKEAASARLEKFIAPGEKPPDPDKKLSLKRQQILSIVAEKKEISLTALRSQVPTAPRLIKLLAQDGRVTIFQRRVCRDPFGDPVEPDTPPELTSEQADAVNTVRNHLDQGFVPYLLAGVTGSGKTEVYLRLAADAVARGKSAIVLVPEIALISQTERRFRARFGEQIAVIHSMLSQGERLDQWHHIATGKVSIVIGARSAIFAPFDNIGIIIVDEEHDGSYKQENGLRYNARDLAVVRARMCGCPVVLGSATPSVQTSHNVRTGRFHQLDLLHRVNDRPLPQITLVDLKKYADAPPMDRIITPELAKAIRACLEAGNQALIFLNRRGFASFPACSACHQPLQCRHCDITMTLHLSAHLYKCHLCGFCLPESTACPSCGKKAVKNFGFGTEKIESMLKTMFPDARLARMDQDSTARKGSALSLLKSIRNRTVDLIVGTQMLAKGHDFPAITLVGVICADLSMNLPDFRAGERTFQLLAQVSGRAGRGDVPGTVIMQTYNPDHFTIEAARRQDVTAFYNREIPFRKALKYPPFTRMILVKLSGPKKDVVAQAALDAPAILTQTKDTTPEMAQTVDVLGPIEAPIPRISSRFRWQLVIKSPSFHKISALVQALQHHPDITRNRAISLGIDVDPYSLM